MQIKVFILIISVLTLISATTQDDVHQIIEELKLTQFGQSIVDTIAIQLNSPDPLQNLINLLQELNTKLEGEQQRDDGVQERTQTQCENDISELEGIIKEATSSSKLLKSQIDSISPDKQAKETDLVRKQNEFQELKAELEYQSGKREEEKARYEETLDHLEQGLYAINETKKLFNEFLNVLIKNKQRFSNSFIETNNNNNNRFLDNEQQYQQQTFLEISAQINKLKHNVKAEGFNFLLHGIAHITTLLQSDKAEDQENMSRKVLEIMGQVENWIQKQRIQEDLSEQQRQDAFSQLSQMLEDHIIFSQQTITTLEGQIEALFSQMSGAQNEKAEVDQKLNVKSAQMEDRDTECRNADLNYRTEKNRRDKERKDIEKALDLVINNIGQLKKEVITK